jgi:hypothetical protein
LDAGNACVGDGGGDVGAAKLPFHSPPWSSNDAVGFLFGNILLSILCRSPLTASSLPLPSPRKSRDRGTFGEHDVSFGEASKSQAGDALALQGSVVLCFWEEMTSYDTRP